MTGDSDKLMVGATELCDLPELEIKDLNVRIDTGAKTSSLHVDNPVEFERDGKRWVAFDIHPDIHNVEQIVRREARVKDLRVVKSSNGMAEKRYLVDTVMRIGNREWRIDLTLTDRSGMTYLMLLGRQAMAGKMLVDPGSEYLLGGAKK